MLQTESKGEYTVEWGSVVQLVRQGIKPVPLRAGDHLIITGSVNKNPEKKILHTVQVERNGFIHAMLTGTPYENAGYEYFGERAYLKWIEP